MSTTKKLYFSSSAVLILLVLVVITSSPAQVHAQEAVTLPVVPNTTLIAPPVETIDPLIAKSNSLIDLQARGARLIAARITSLNSLKTKIQNNKNLTDTQKSALSAQIDGRVAALNALAGQIKAATTVDSVRQLDQSIYTGYRIYAIVIPQINRSITLDTLTAHLNTLNTTAFAKVQARIDAAKAKNKNVTNWQNNLNAAKGMVAGVQSKIDTAMQKVSALQPSDYPANSKTIFADVKTSITSIRKDILTMHANLRMVK